MYASQKSLEKEESIMKKIKKILKKTYKWIILLICLIIFLGILEDIFEYQKLELDTIIYEIIILNLRAEPFTIFMHIITNLGGAYPLIAISVLSIVIMKNKKIGYSISINLIIITLLNLILKNIVQRPRPEGYRLIDETGYSFPSGHSMVSTAFYGLIIYIIWKNVKNKTIKYTSCTLLSILVILIGISRIYLGVHYASDVLGGFLISIAYLIVYITVTKFILQIQNNEMKNENERQKTLLTKS